MKPLAERLIGKCADAAKKVDALKKSYVGKKFALGYAIRPVSRLRPPALTSAYSY